MVEKPKPNGLSFKREGIGSQENGRGYTLLLQGWWNEGSAEILGAPSASSHPRKWKPQQTCLGTLEPRPRDSERGEALWLLPFPVLRWPAGAFPWTTQPTGLRGSRGRQGLRLRANRLTTCTSHSKSTTVRDTGCPELELKL